MKFISISGKARAGKDSVRKFIADYLTKGGYTVATFSFANPLKDALCMWFNWDRARMDYDTAYKEGDTLDDGSPDPYCEAFGLTRRQLMQRVGTDCLRDHLNPNVWIILADLGVKLGKTPPVDYYIVPDARFQNELAWIKDIGGFEILVRGILVKKGESIDDVYADYLNGAETANFTEHHQHASETDFENWQHYDMTIENIIDENQAPALGLLRLKEFSEAAVQAMMLDDVVTERRDPDGMVQSP